MAFIANYGVYVPRGRVGSEVFKTIYGKGLPGARAVSMAEIDEDSLTMGYEAVKRIIPAGGIDGLILASNSLPFGGKKGSSLLGKMLRLSPSVPCYDLAGGPLAAAEALLLAAELVGGGSRRCVAVVAAEHPRYYPGEEVEMAWGDGAAAFVISADGFASIDDVMADYEVESYDLWTLPGEEQRRYRPEMLDDNFDRAMERLVAARGGTEKLDGYRFTALQINRHRWTRSLGKRGIQKEQWEPVSALSLVGNLGSATFGVNLALALERAVQGDRILAVGYGHGNTVSFSLTIKGDPSRHEVQKQLEMDMPVDLATYWRTVFQRRFGA